MSTRGKVKLAVLIGGGGRLASVCEGVKRFDWQPGAEIELILSYKRQSAGLQWATSQGYDAQYRRWSDWKKQGHTRQEYDQALTEILEKYGIELVVLAGWGLLLSAEFIRHWAGRVINVHPALLTETFEPNVSLSTGQIIPVFRGNDAIEQALAAHVPTTGCTVHYVTEQMDAGPILLKREVAILPTDTVETLGDRIHAAEEESLPLGIEMACRSYLTKI